VRLATQGQTLSANCISICSLSISLDAHGIVIYANKCVMVKPKAVVLGGMIKGHLDASDNPPECASVYDTKSTWPLHFTSVTENARSLMLDFNALLHNVFSAVQSRRREVHGNMIMQLAIKLFGF
jgi:hypothetical protein